MNNTTINIKVDQQIKQILRDRTLTLSTELEPTPYLVSIMQQVEDDIRAKKGTKTTTTPKELVSHLDSL